MGKREREAIAQVPLFQSLSSRHQRRVADLASEERLMEGATIVREGDIGDTFYVILEGEAKVTSASGRVVNRMRPGEFFGEISLLDGGPRTATVVADTPMTLIGIERKAFLRAIADEPEIGVRLLAHAAGMLRRLGHPVSG
ncbi:MAG TPA: cyclic nucleotide-binding domain-containing protein [Actinomycetota bacterium]|nr:cyclic nucleotide-binding domain-containing protein [Actinomycetota bacterium]